MMRPWKLITLAIGLAILIAGSFYEQLNDWDVGVSLVMGILTYLTAPFVCRTIIRLDWRMLLPAAFCAWFSIDGSYWLYNLAIGHNYVREANAIASTPLYFICGLVWMWDGSIKDFICSMRLSLPAKRPSSQP